MTPLRLRYHRRMLITLVLISSLTLNAYPWTRGSSPSTPIGSTLASPSVPVNNGTVLVSPAKIGDTTNYPIGHTFDVPIKVANASSFNSFDVSVMTVVTILRPIALNPGDVFAGQVLPLTNCINAIGLGCSQPPGGVDNAGVVTSGQELLSGQTPDRDNATLFTITYNVTGIGSTSIRILSTVLSVGPSKNAIQLTTSSQGGSFSNRNCGSALCVPPQVGFTVRQNSTLVEGRPVFFNASTTRTLNPGASIVSYTWIFGNGDSSKTFTNNTSHTYPHAENFVVILVVNDTSNALGIWSHRIRVIRFLIDLAIGPDDLLIDQATSVIPGTKVHIRVTVTNVGSKSENESISIILGQGARGNLTLSQSSGSQYLNVTAGEKRNLNATWDTTGFLPKVYPVIGHVDPVRNGTQIVENVTSNNEVVGYVQLVDPVPPGLSLSLVTGASLAGLLIVAAGASVLRKLFSRKPELDIGS